MRNKIIFSTTLLALLFALGSCHMHAVQGTPYRVWHVTKRTHRHFGAPRSTNNRSRFWGHRRFGPRPYKYRGRYRNFQ